MSVLDDIVVGVREDLARRQAQTSEADLRARLLDIPPALQVDPVSQPKGCEPRRRTRPGTTPLEHRTLD